MAKSHKTCMEQAEIIDTFGTYQSPGDKPWYLCQGKFSAILLLNLPLGVTNEGAIVITRLGSCDAGVMHIVCNSPEIPPQFKFSFIALSCKLSDLFAVFASPK